LFQLSDIAELAGNMQMSENAGPCRNLNVFLSVLKRLDVSREEVVKLFEESGVDLVSFIPNSSEQANEVKVVEELTRLQMNFLDKTLVLKVQINKKLKVAAYNELMACCEDCQHHQHFIPVVTNCVLSHIFPGKLISKEQMSVSQDLLEFLEQIVTTKQQQTQFVTSIDSYCRNLDHSEGLQKYLLKIFHFEGIIDQNVLVEWKTDLLGNIEKQNDVLSQVKEWLKSLELSDSSDSD